MKPYINRLQKKNFSITTLVSVLVLTKMLISPWWWIQPGIYQLNQRPKGASGCKGINWSIF